jgi:hypothetical protein
MVPRCGTPDSRFQVSLLQVFLWITAVAIVCGLAKGLIGYLGQVEATNGSIPTEVVGRSLFFGFLAAASFVGLMVGPPLCFFVSLWRWRMRNTPGEKCPPARPTTKRH